MPSSARRILFCVLASLALFTAWLPRLLLGVDFTDEAFPLAVAKHLSHGARLFIDETDIHQTTAPYLYPFFRLLAFFSPDLAGLFIFMRLVPLLTMALICGVFIKRHLQEFPLLASLIIVSPLLIYAPGPANGTIYSIGAYLAWTGLLLSDLRSIGKKTAGQLIVSGIFAGALTGFYLAPVFIFIFTAPLLLLYKKISLPQTGLLLLGYFLGLLPIVCFLPGTAPLAHAIEVFRINTQLHYPLFTYEKFQRFVFNSKSHVWQLLLLPAGYYLRQATKFHFIMLSVFSALGILFFLSGTAMNFQADRLALGAWLFVAGAALGEPALRKRIGISTWLLTAGLAIVTSYTTNARGILTFAWVLAPLCVLIFSEMMRDFLARHPQNRFSLLAPIAFLSIGLFVLHAKFNYDQAFSPDLAMVKSGPYRFLWADKNKVKYLAAATETISKTDAGANLFIFYNFPAGYLIAKSPPMTNSMWAFFDSHENTPMNKKILQRFEREGSTPTFVIEMKYLIGKRSPTIPYVVQAKASNEIKQYLTLNQYELLEETDIMRLYRVPGAGN